MGVLTAEDAMREAFIVGATEAEVIHGDPFKGDATLYVRGLNWRQRRKLAESLEEWVPINAKLRVKKMGWRKHG
jgi:hypothetical protein